MQGFSTGLPERLQLALLRTLPGLESCKMLRPAYAVEYDYLPAHQCSNTLETKKVNGLFFSGQLNGTTGRHRDQGTGHKLQGWAQARVCQRAWGRGWRRCSSNILDMALRRRSDSAQWRGRQLPMYSKRATLPRMLLHPAPCLLDAGYEEAAAQGLLAGINAARRVQSLEPIALTRDSSYLGTLIDDLVTKDLREPYRMLTSRCTTCRGEDGRDQCEAWWQRGCFAALLRMAMQLVFACCGRGIGLRKARGFAGLIHVLTWTLPLVGPSIGCCCAATTLTSV